MDLTSTEKADVRTYDHTKWKRAGQVRSSWVPCGWRAGWMTILQGSVPKPGFQGESVDCHLAVAGNEHYEREVDRMRQPTERRSVREVSRCCRCLPCPEGRGLLA